MCVWFSNNDDDDDDDDQFSKIWGCHNKISKSRKLWDEVVILIYIIYTQNNILVLVVITMFRLFSTPAFLRYLSIQASVKEP